MQEWFPLKSHDQSCIVLFPVLLIRAILLIAYTDSVVILHVQMSFESGVRETGGDPGLVQ